MCFYKYKDLLALMLIILILAPCTYVYAYACTYSYSVFQEFLNRSRATIDFIIASFKVNTMPFIIGSKISSLHVATCVNNELIEGVIHIIPRKYVESFLPSLNKS